MKKRTSSIVIALLFSSSNNKVRGISLREVPEKTDRWIEIENSPEPLETADV